tara:strand:+ start:84 stop:686 length:603 start_codon:yes stop_codon:yes gene_type:complete
MSQSNENPQEILASIKSNLSEGVINRNHGFHTPIFSNIDLNQIISSKVVVLRNYNSNKNFFSFHTDYRSKKIKEITKNPKTHFTFYDKKEKIQLRIQTTSEINYNNQITSEAWKKTKLASRKCYLSKKAPSSFTNIAEDGISNHLSDKDPLEKESEIGYSNFSVIINLIEKIDWLYLSSTGHKRLLINFLNKEAFQWLIP